MFALNPGNGVSNSVCISPLGVWAYPVYTQKKEKTPPFPRVSRRTEEKWKKKSKRRRKKKCERERGTPQRRRPRRERPVCQSWREN